jgi:hypothetical protein
LNTIAIPLVGSIVIILCAVLFIRINTRNKRKPKAAPAIETVSKEPTIKTTPPSEAQQAVLKKEIPKPIISRLSPRPGICDNCGEKKYLVIRVENKRFCYQCSEKKGYIGQTSQQMPVSKRESKD